MGRLTILAVAVALLVAVGVTGCARAADAPRFFSTIEDLPLMPGLVEDDAAGVVFDSPQGRIVEAFASGGVAERDVRQFYTATLPQLGWSETSPGAFSREREILKIEFPKDRNKGDRLTVRFALAPAAE